MVAARAAGFTVASLYGFEGLGTNRDPARLAGQIVSGIGFLGVGVIFRANGAVRGLTTAASIWMVAALGVLAGLGLYWRAAFATLLTLFVLRVVKGAEHRERRGPTPGGALPGPDDRDARTPD